MAICSYVVQPVEGAAERLEKALNALDGCEAYKAADHDLLILITETSSSDEEKKLREKLKALPDIAALNLSFGEVDPTLQKENSP